MKNGIIYVPALAASFFESHDFEKHDFYIKDWSVNKRQYAITENIDIHLNCSIKTFNPYNALTIQIYMHNESIVLSEIILKKGDGLNPESMLILELPQMPETVKISIKGMQYNSLIEGLSPCYMNALALYKVSRIETHNKDQRVTLFSQKIKVKKGTSLKDRCNGFFAKNINPILLLEDAQEINSASEVDMSYRL